MIGARRAVLILSMLTAHSGSTGEPEVRTLPGMAEIGGQILGAAISAQVRGPALLERAKRMDDVTLVAELGALHRRRNGLAALRDGRDAPAGDPETSLLGRVLANPDALSALEWLPADQQATAATYFDDWQAALHVRGSDDAARLDVEPADSLFKKTIAATTLARYRVVQAGDFGETTLIAPDDQGESCCRVLHWMFMEEVPIAFSSLRQHLQAQWVAAELLEDLPRAGSTDAK